MQAPPGEIIFDKAKWHLGGDFPTDLDEHQAYVHTGMFVGWLIHKGLLDTELARNAAASIEKWRLGEMTAAQEAIPSGIPFLRR